MQIFGEAQIADPGSDQSSRNPKSCVWQDFLSIRVYLQDNEAGRPEAFNFRLSVFETLI